MKFLRQSVQEVNALLEVDGDDDERRNKSMSLSLRRNDEPLSLSSLIVPRPSKITTTASCNVTTKYQVREVMWVDDPLEGQCN